MMIYLYILLYIYIFFIKDFQWYSEWKKIFCFVLCGDFDRWVGYRCIGICDLGQIYVVVRCLDDGGWDWQFCVLY